MGERNKDAGTCFMPREDGTTQPAPYVMTASEVATFCRISAEDAEQSLKRYRDKAWLRCVQVGKSIRFLLPDVLEFLRNAQEENPR